jgi:hypothetical protein
VVYGSLLLLAKTLNAQEQANKLAKDNPVFHSQLNSPMIGLARKNDFDSRPHLAIPENNTPSYTL